MPDLLAVALAVVLSFVLGTLAGASRAFRLVSSARKLRTAHSRIARFMPDAPPTRTAADILAGRIRVVLGGITYTLPVLPRNASRAWLEKLDADFATLTLALDAAGDDYGQILALMATQTDTLYDTLLAYDTTHVLPSRAEADETATDAEILHAVLEVWRAANPLVATVAESASPPTTGSSPEPRSSPPSPMAGDPTTSSGSPTSSSSPISTPRRTASASAPNGGSTSKSKRSASGRSSPTTRSRTSAGASGLESTGNAG